MTHDQTTVERDSEGCWIYRSDDPFVNGQPVGAIRPPWVNEAIRSAETTVQRGKTVVITPGQSFGFSDSASKVPRQQDRKLPPEPGKIPRNLPVPADEILKGNQDG